MIITSVLGSFGFSNFHKYETLKTKTKIEKQFCSALAKMWVKMVFSANLFHRAFHGFGQAKFPDGGLVLGLSQFSILPQLPQKTMLCLKGVKINSKISNLCRLPKSVTHSVVLNTTRVYFQL